MIWTLAIRTLLLLFFVESSWASYIKISDSNSTGSNTTTLAGTLSLVTDSNNDEQFDDISNWSIDWLAGQTNSSLNLPNEITRFYDTSLSYSNEDLFNIAVGGVYEKSQIGAVQSLGPVVTISRSWKYGHLFVREEPRKIPADRTQIQDSAETSDGGDIEVEEFKSSLGFSLTGKKKDYSQKGSKGNLADFQISQSFVELALNLNPITWLGVSALYGKYNYDKDVIAFNNLINQPAVALARGTDLVDGYSSALQGFTDYEYGLTLTFRITESSNLDIGFTKSIGVISRIWTTDTDISFNSDFSKNFGYSIGGSQSNSTDSNTASYSANASLSYFY